MEETVDEVKYLKACLNNLISILALPAIWTGGESHEIVTALLDVLLGMLRLDFVYVGLKGTAGSAPIEMIRPTQSGNSADRPRVIDAALKASLRCETHTWPLVIQNPTGEGDVSIAAFRLGLNDEMGVLVAGSRRADFPDASERLLLSVAANQATIGLQEARLLGQQRRLAQELDQKVAQRTRELDRFFTISPDLLCIADQHGYFRELSQTWEKTLGYARSELLARPFMDFVHPEDVTETRAAYADVIAGRNVVNFINRYRCKNGAYRWLEWSAASGDQMIYATARDITEQEQRIEELRRSEFYLAEGQRLAHTGSWAFNPSGFYEHWSRELFQIYGLDPGKGAPTLEQYLGTVHPQDREFMARTIEGMLAEGLGCDVKKRIVRPNGELRYVRCVGVPVVDKGILKSIVGTAMDVTEQEQMTQELRRSEAYLAEAQRVSHTGSFGWRVSTGEILWSEETFRIFEYDRTTKPTMELLLQRVHPEDVTLVKQIIDRAPQDGKGFDLEHRLLMPDGSIKRVHVVAHAAKDEAGNVEFVGAVTDITEQHRARAALEKAFDEIRTLKEELYKENLALKEEIDQASMFEEIVGSSAALRRVLVHVAKVAPTDSTVLITGETGTGKELVARAIHKRSHRATQPFVSVNCAAIPPSLIAAELFGHEKGAFTGATQRRLGRFELAGGGTIFLDEIGELPPETQVTLLRVLQERAFERVGGSQAIAVNVRVLAATNRDLHAAVAAGTFRRDLFYRLNVFPIHVPPLRDRVDDIPLLVEYITERYASKAGKRIRSVKKKTLELFQAYDWPGNIRELQNVVERAVILCDGDSLAVDEAWLQHESPRPRVAGRGLGRPDVNQEKEMIESALAESQGRVSGPRGAAAKLGIPRSTLESRIRSLQLNKYRFKSGEIRRQGDS